MNIDSLPIIISIIAIALFVWVSLQQRVLIRASKQTSAKYNHILGHVSDLLMDHYFGPIGSDRRTWEEDTLKKYPSRTRMGSILFQIHHHGDNCTDDEIVYKEKDVIHLLEQLGFSVKFGDEK